MDVSFRSPGGSQSTTVGRTGLVVGCAGGGADLELEDPRLDAKHGRVWFDGAVVWYLDLESKTGSYFHQRRLQDRVSLEPGDEITLGDTTLSLSAQPALEGMELRMSGGVGRTTVNEILGGAGQRARYVAALSDFVQDLLNSTDAESLDRTVHRLNEVIPGGQTSLVAWPFGPGGKVEHLVPPSEKARPISRSLAQKAVNRAEALLFSEGFPQDVEVEQSTKVKGIRSAVYIPLAAEDGEVLAILCIDSPSPRFALDPDAFQFMRAVGGLLSSALAADDLREQARLKELEAREEESHREALANFLKIASHDLRSPLAIVRGFSNLIDKATDLDTVKKLNARVRNAGNRADALIRAYLEVSALTSDRKLALHLENLNLQTLVDEEIQFVEDSQGEHTTPHRFINAVTGGLTVRADSLKLRQILNNLLTNAARYTREPGEIKVEAEDQGEQVVMRVVDSGVGISVEDQELLFRQFQRAGNPGDIPGTGLGLWLTAALVSAHGGEISVSSTPGEGSTFSFTLPGIQSFTENSG